jgi:hypothetical protein
MKCNLLDTTLELAGSTSVPITVICRAIKVTPRWYQKMVVGEIKDPSVRRIQRLHDFLIEHQTDESAAA